MSKKISEAGKRIGQGSKEILEIGDISLIKEWTYAGDIAEGVWTLLNQHKVWEAIISGGLGYLIENWLRDCFSLINKDWTNFVRRLRKILYQNINSLFLILPSSSIWAGNRKFSLQN